MTFIKSLTLIIGLSIILTGCSSFSDAGKILRNDKIRNTDEFLIKKKEPLTQPPDFEKILEPGSKQSQTATNQNSIEKILKTTKSNSSDSPSKSSSTEESILKKIKK
jgi:PBP1b-binding outer membrane lipoprotein LpoB|tara:strand:- start:4949 stop:5269 length:321 start_codon:yes stop_codon:yes gene_type:complete